jgi:peptide/nickel transport system substrate-binding protein
VRRDHKPFKRTPAESAGGESTELDRFSRRGLLQRGGIALAGAVVLDACGSSGGSGSGATSTPTGSGISAGYPQRNVLPPSRGGGQLDQIVIALTSDVQKTDPAFSYDLNSNPVMTQVTEALVRTTPDGRIIPNLAESWSEVDPVTYVYKLRSGVPFHDGSIMTAEDAAFSLQRNMDPSVGSFYAGYYQHVKSVEATGPLELTVKLKTPFTFWKYQAGSLGAAVGSKKFYERHGKNVGSPSVGVIGTGPYRYVSWTPTQQVVLEANPHYWDTSRKPLIHRFVYKILEDESTIVQGLAAGSIDLTWNLSGRSFAELGNTDTQLLTGPSVNLNYLALNCKKPPFNDRRVRQAIAYATDRPGLLASSYGNYGKVVRSMILSDQWIFSKDVFQSAYGQLPSYDLNLSKAKELLKSAGVGSGQTWTTLVGTDYDEQEALGLAATLSELGIKLNTQRMPVAQKYALEFDGKPTRPYDMSITIWGADFPDPAGNVYPTLSTGFAQNEVVYESPAVNSLLQQQIGLDDGPQRAKLLTQAQAMIMDDSPWNLFFESYTLLALSKRVVVNASMMRPIYYFDTWGPDVSGART